MSLDEEALIALRRVLEEVGDNARTPLSAVAAVQSTLPAGASVTIDFRAGETLGHPLLVLEHAPPPPRWWTALSTREQEVALLMAQGCSNRDIGERLYIATSTVKDHVHHILQKSNLRRRTEVSAALSRLAVAAVAPATSH